MDLIQQLLYTLIDSYVSVSLNKRLISISSDMFLDRVVTAPTRGPNILDLCFTTHPSSYYSKLLRSYIIQGLNDHLASCYYRYFSLYLLAIPKS